MSNCYARTISDLCSSPECEHCAPWQEALRTAGRNLARQREQMVIDSVLLNFGGLAARVTLGTSELVV